MADTIAVEGFDDGTPQSQGADLPFHADSRLEKAKKKNSSNEENEEVKDVIAKLTVAEVRQQIVAFLANCETASESQKVLPETWDVETMRYICKNIASAVYVQLQQERKRANLTPARVIHEKIKCVTKDVIGGMLSK